MSRIRRATRTQPDAEPQISDRNNVDVVVLSTYLGGGGLRHIDTEDIAIKTREVAPGRFSWRKYPDQVNIEQVRRRLSEAKAHGLLAGSQTKGWMLTAAGSRYVESNLVQLARGTKGRTSIAMADRQWRAAERKRLRLTTAFKKYRKGQRSDINSVDVGEFFRIDSYMSREARETKLNRFINAFRSDDELGQIVADLAARLGEKEAS